MIKWLRPTEFAYKVLLAPDFPEADVGIVALELAVVIVMVKWSRIPGPTSNAPLTPDLPPPDAEILSPVIALVKVMEPDQTPPENAVVDVGLIVEDISLRLLIPT
jgi:hypothetical protein